MNYFHNKRNRYRAILTGLFIILSLVSFLAYNFFNQVFTNIKGEEIITEEAGIEEATKDRINQYDHKRKNILLVGIDRNTNPDDPQRSDTMMILSLDDQNKKLKLSSLLRDTHVKIDGFGTTKLNHSYAYGGVKLLLKTVNQNFAMDIDDYVVVDFHNLIAIIDAVNGIEMDIKPNEIFQINFAINNLNLLEGTNVAKIKKAGRHHLNGTQATAYARIRKTSGGEYGRTERQRLLLTKVYEKVRKAPLQDLPGYITKLSPFVKTSLSYNEIFDFGLKILGSKFTVEGTHFPTPDHSKEVSKNSWYIKMNKSATIEELHQFIYFDQMPTSAQSYLEYQNKPSPSSQGKPPDDNQAAP